jgi:hypothetical protein
MGQCTTATKEIKDNENGEQLGFLDDGNTRNHNAKIIGREYYFDNEKVVS